MNQNTHDVKYREKHQIHLSLICIFETHLSQHSMRTIRDRGILMSVTFYKLSITSRCLCPFSFVCDFFLDLYR